jgi:hypothetical protein
MSGVDDYGEISAFCLDGMEGQGGPNGAQKDDYVGSIEIHRYIYGCKVSHFS